MGEPALLRVVRLGLALAIFAALALAVPAAAKEPPFTVRTALLSAAFHCHGALQNATAEPILLVTGTGATGEETYAFEKGAFDALGHPVCDVNFPSNETADIQISVQYLVYAIRRESKQSGRQIAIFGISQGGLLPRFALTYWPDLRAKVTDVLAAAGTEHGTTVPPFANGQLCSARRPCPPAVWQQRAGSHLLGALGAQRSEAPGPTAWTTVRSSTDEVVQPQTGERLAPSQERLLASLRPRAGRGHDDRAAVGGGRPDLLADRAGADRQGRAQGLELLPALRSCLLR